MSSANKTTHDGNHDQRIRFYFLEGTHYEYSFKLGELTKDHINERIKKNADDLKPLFKFIKTDAGSKYLNSYTTAIQNKYPWYYDELKGISDGSQVPLEQILVLNYKNELKAAKDLDDEKEQNEEGRSSCSVVHINRLDNDEQLLYIAHNEDESDANWNTSFILQAKIKSSIYKTGQEGQQRESPNERYIAFAYAGQVVGNGFAANYHGFVFTYNGLYPKTPLIENCLPRQLHNRAVLSVENEEQLNQLLKTEISAYGFNLNVGRFRYSDGISDKYLWNCEVGPSNDGGKTNQCHVNYILNEQQFKDEQFIDKRKIIPSFSCSINYYCHFNHYIHIQTIPEEDKPLPSSKMRTQRAEEYGDIKFLDQALQFLGDEKYKSKHPVYRRSSTGKTNTVTLCTAVIDLKKSFVYVYDDNPAKKEITPFFQFDLNNL